MSYHNEKLSIIDTLHKKFGSHFFTRNPYIKFLPLIFFPPKIDWNLAKPCAKKSNLHIVLPVFGNDNIALRGWGRFAEVAVFSLLCSPGIENYSIEITIGKSQVNLDEAQIDYLFDSKMFPDYVKLNELNVHCRQVEEPLNTTNIFNFCNKESEIILRCDADNGFKCKSLKDSLFSFQSPLGDSGLNFRITGRNGFDELFHVPEGRMCYWEPYLQREPDDFLQRVCTVISNIFKIKFTNSRLRNELKKRPWPSVGLSYIKPKILPEYRILRDALQHSELTPIWDREIIELLLACIFNFNIEQSRIQIIDYWESLPKKTENVIIHFGSIVRIHPNIGHLLHKNVSNFEQYFSFISNFVKEISSAAKENFK